MNKKIIILDYESGQVFVVNDNPDFYGVDGDLVIMYVLEFIDEEHNIFLFESNINWMLSNDAVINLL